MKCDDIKELLPALAGGDLGLSRDEEARCQEHLEGCSDCRQNLESLKRTLKLLHRVGESEQLPSGFQLSLHRRLAAEPPPTPSLIARLWRLLEQLQIDSAPRIGLALGAAALLGLVVLPQLRHGSGSALHNLSGEQEVAAAFRVPQQRIAVVRFDFVADVKVEDVEFEVTLPNELNFIDEGKVLAEKRLVWRGSLASGSNPIPLAVRGSKPGRYRVTAQAHGGGLDVRHDILLEVVRS
jgi:hypothetical protein